MKVQGAEAGLDFQTQEFSSIFEYSEPVSHEAVECPNGHISANRNNKVQRDWKCRRCQSDNISTHMRCLQCNLHRCDKKQRDR